MRAIILAAGRGKRLEHFNPDGRPKCLLELGGISLLERQLRLLKTNGLHEVDLVLGYQAERIVDYVGQLHDRPRISYHHNPRFAQGSVLSLHTAAGVMTSGEDVLVMDADVLFHPDILHRLCTSPHENCYLIDHQFVPGDEPVKIALHNGVMVEFRKALAPGLQYDDIGESVGFFRFGPAASRAIAATCAGYDSGGRGEAPHEEVLRDVLLEHPGWFACEDISGLPWLELDFPEDVERALNEVLPAIQRGFPGF